MSTTPVTDALDKQCVLEPGQSGYWKVYGASARHLQVGDLVMAKWAGSDGSVTEHEVTQVIEHMCGKRIVDANGDTMLIGFLQPIVVLRFGTKNTLA